MTESEILIIHACGTTRATTLSLALSAKFANGVAIRPPGDEVVSADIEVFNPQKLGRLSDVVSVISGQPAIIYRRGKLEIALTPTELIRMALRDLRPSEMTTLRDRFGDIEEISLAPHTVDPAEPRRISTWRGFLGRLQGLGK